MSKIPTAEEFLNKYNYPSMRFCNVCMNFEKDLQKMLIEFAKFHVEAALKEVLEDIPCLGSSTDIPSYEEVKDAVLNAYPLENIK